MKTRITLRSIHKLAFPAIISSVTEPLLSITDTAIVGNISIDATESLAAAGIVGAFLSMLVWTLGQSRNAISAIIARYLGAGMLQRIRTMPAQAILFNLIIGIVVLLICLFWSSEILIYLNADGKVLFYAERYFNIRILGFPLTLFIMCVIGVFRGLQNTYWPMLISLVGVITNILLDVLLVYGVESYIPAMGLEGAAWASIISQCIMSIMAIILLIIKTPIPIKIILPVHTEIKRIITMCLNLFIRSLALNTVLMTAVKEATAMGENYIGAHTIIINLWLLFALLIDGYASAADIIGGRLAGENNYKSLVLLVKKILRYSFLISLVIMLFSYLFRYQIGGIFTNDTLVLKSFNSIYIIFILSMPFNAIAFVLDALFKGLGEVIYLRNVLLISTLLIFFPVLYLSKYLDWELEGIWIAINLWMVSRGTIISYYFIKKYVPLTSKTDAYLE